MLLKIHGPNKDDLKEVTIQFRHIRPPGRNMPKPKGGMTILAGVTLGYKLPRIYVAQCHPDDFFSKRMGMITCVKELIHDTMGKDLYVSTYGFLEGGKILEMNITDKVIDNGSGRTSKPQA